MKIKKILDNRTFLMGIAMLMIVIFHCNFPLEHGRRFYLNLCIGVDMFLFFSGMGIVQSLNKNNNIKEFYKKRIKRILPTTVPLIVFFSFLMLIFVENFGGEEFYLQITGLNFILEKGNYPMFMWFIPCILIYYLISPFIYNLIKNEKFDKKFYIKLFIVLFLCYLIPAGSKGTTLNNLFGRLPIYVLGIIYGMRCIKKETISSKEIGIICILSIIAIVGIYYPGLFKRFYLSQFRSLLYVPLVLLLSIFFTYILDKTKGKKRILTIIGKSTLAIYCSQEFIMLISLGIINKYYLYEKYYYDYNVYTIVFAILGLTCGILWTKIIDYLFSSDSKAQRKLKTS